MKKTFGRILLILGSILFPFSAFAVELTNPLGIDDPKLFIARILRYALGFLGIMALIMILYGGFLMLTSGGNADMIKKAKSTIIWAALGIVIIISSWQILSFILNTINQVSK
ncbi:MAG: hypothetical protein WCT08_05185 [Patescibacteria group bacterium]